MKKLVVLCGVALFTAGCGTLCDRVEDFQGKDLKGTCEGVTTNSDWNKDKCEEKIGECTAADEDAINAAYDCLDDVSACEKGKELEWAAKLADCASKMKDVTGNCNAALSGK